MAHEKEITAVINSVGINQAWTNCAALEASTSPLVDPSSVMDGAVDSPKLVDAKLALPEESQRYHRRPALHQCSSSCPVLRQHNFEEAILDLLVGLLLREVTDLCASDKAETSDSIQSSDALSHRTTKRDF